MKLAYKTFAAWLGFLLILAVPQPKISAQALPPQPRIIFNSFAGSYHLSRDASGRSLLTTEEVILAEFPGSGNFTGITRAIPKTYQGHSVDVRVLSVTDAAGSPVPYKTSTDASNNLIVTTGDPAITLFGPQTFRISYQTRDVVNLNTPQNEFLLNINGRGWDQPFNQVSAVVHLPKTFIASLSNKPGCYIGYLNSSSLNCSVTSQTTDTENLISVKALGPIAAHNALVAKLEFKPATFSNKKDFWDRGRLIKVTVASASVILASYWCARYIRRRWS